MVATPNPLGLGLEAGANRLLDYNPHWALAFAEEAARIRLAVGPLALEIEHYGSTAVPGLRAKPIIDMLIGVPDINDGLKMIQPMERIGYSYATDHGIPNHHIFGRPTVRQFLAHVVVYGGDQWRRSLRFRDRLKADVDARVEYEALKERLAAAGLSRADYTEGKTESCSRTEARSASNGEPDGGRSRKAEPRISGTGGVTIGDPIK